jgi:TonB-linked SusC/RagA family outer membrane protein
LLPDGSGRFTSRAWPQIEVFRGEKNLLGLAAMGGAWNRTVGLNGSVSTDVNLRENLTWTTRLGMQHDQTRNKWHRPLIPTYNWFTGDFDMYADRLSEILLNRRDSLYTYYTAYSTLNYNASFGGVHNLAVMAGTSVEKRTGERLEGSRRGFASQDLDVLDAGPAEGQTAGGRLNEYGLTSLFGRVNYNYLGKYLLEATIRRDGSSRFPPANKYAVFPAVSAGWRLSEEGFIRNRMPFLEELKLRASYGLLGKDDVRGDYPYQAALRTGYDYPFGDQVQAGVARVALNNERIRWEETKIADVGLDLLAARGISLTADYYVKTTSGILRPSQLPGYAGLDAPVVNQGVVRNKGLELTLGYQSRVGEVQYGATAVFATYRNKVTKFGAPEIGGTTIMKEGLEIDRYFLYEADGIYKSQAEIEAGPKPLLPAVPGDIRLKDLNGDGSITADDRTDVDGRHPNFEYGLDLSASWKGLDLSAFVQGEQGRKAFVNDWHVRPFQGGGGIISWWRDAWSPENPNSEKPRLVHSEFRSTSVWANSTYWLRDVSYLRLRNVTLGYTLPQSLSQKMRLDRARLYLTGENVLTLTPFEFGNPEQANTGSYPFYRTLMLGLDVAF